MPFLVIIAIVLILILLRVNKAKIRGRQGERLVKWLIGSTKENIKYVINDLIIANDSMTSQIDHIVINARGVFVIETKNYSGEIYGAENQQEWTQVLAFGKVKNKMYNPLKQNATHVYNVKRIVGDLPVRSLVVFVQNNTKHINAKNVIPILELNKELRRGQNVLSIKQMKEAYEALNLSRAKITRQEHVDNILKQRYDLKHGICPRCGGKLVLRNGKYGEFWGCSNYPECKFIKNK